MLLGGHESIAGGLPKAFERAAAHGCEAFQIFVKNARGWAARPLPDDEVAAFRAAARGGPKAAMAHASYLINLAAEPGVLRDRSLAALADELGRCERLGIPGLVVHPGTHGSASRGVELAAQAIDEVLSRVPGKAGIWLENTAGQGTTLCARFDQLGALLDRVRASGRVAVCFDTCHAFAAGYDLRTEAAYRATMAELLSAVGGARSVRGFHLNDSKKPLGCRVDRHEEIGKGEMGRAPFRLLLQDGRFARVPGVLETPDPERYPAGLRSLRRLIQVPAILDGSRQPRRSP